MTRRYAFVGCGKAKNPGELPAREKYASTYFQKKAKWAEKYCDEWWILSAKYGAIEPDEVIDDYDVTISDLDHKERAAFFRSAWRALRVGYVERIEGQLFVLAGKDYIKALGSLVDPAEWEDYEVILPFEGTEGIGEQLAWLTDQLESGEFDTWEPQTNDRPTTEQTTLIPDGGTESPPGKHPTLENLDVDDTVRVTVDDDVVIGNVDSVRHSEDGEVAGHAVTVMEGGYRGRILDVETQHDPRTGWSELTACERLYTGDPPTEFKELGPAVIEPIDPGVDPDELEPGRVVELLDGAEYRVVVPPWEREYDSKALVFNLESSSNLVEKVSPSEVVRLVR